MLAPKRASRPSSGHARLDAKFFEPILKRLFAQYDLNQDGLISKEAFASTQSLIRELFRSVGDAGSMPADPRARNTSAASSQRSSSMSSLARRRQPRHSVGSPLSVVGGQLVSPSYVRAVSKARVPSPPAQLARYDLELGLPEFVPVRSPSFMAYGSRDVDVGDGLSLEAFLSWQQHLLSASSKHSAEKQQRLSWLTEELSKLDVSKGRSHFWRRRHMALKSLEADADIVCDLEGRGELLAAIQKLEVALKQADCMVEEEASLPTEGQILGRMADLQRHHLVDLKKKIVAEFRTLLEKESISCAALEAKLKALVEVVGEAELAPEFGLLKQMQQPFKLNVLTLAGSQVDVMASRTNSIEQVKELVASELSVWPYRVGFSDARGEVLSSSQTLEELGICDADAAAHLTVVVAPCQRLRELSQQDFINLLMERGLCTRASLARSPWPADVEKDMELRETYFAQLEAVEEQEERQRQVIKEEEEQERQAMEEQEDILRERKKQLQRRQEALEVEEKELILKYGEDGAADNFSLKAEEAERIARKLAEDCMAIRDDAQRDLDEALPELEAAFQALSRLRKSDVVEVIHYTCPPALVILTLEAVCIMFNIRPTWNEARKILNDKCFLDRLIEYDKDNIPAKVIIKLDKYLANNDFRPDNVRRQSMACAAFCMWVRAMHAYYCVAKLVRPKRFQLRIAELRLDDAQVELHRWHACLRKADLVRAATVKKAEEQIAASSV